MLCEWLAGTYRFQVAAGVIPGEIVHTELESLRKVDPEIPEALEQLVARGLNKDREQRVQTAAEFANGLRGIIRQLEPERAVAAQPVPISTSLPPPIPPPVPMPTPTAATAPVAPASARPGRSSSFRNRWMV